MSNRFEIAPLIFNSINTSNNFNEEIIHYTVQFSFPNTVYFADHNITILIQSMQPNKHTSNQWQVTTEHGNINTWHNTLYTGIDIGRIEQFIKSFCMLEQYSVNIM